MQDDSPTSARPPKPAAAPAAQRHPWAAGQGQREDKMDHLTYFQGLYEAFNRRDVKAVLAMMSDEVGWPNAWKGGRLVGREAVREYWAAQWAEIDPHVEPLSVLERADGTLAVTVRQVVRSPGGELLGESQVLHVYQLHDGLIRRMDLEELEQQSH